MVPAHLAIIVDDPMMKNAWFSAACTGWNVGSFCVTYTTQVMIMLVAATSVVA